jgi:conjugative transfer signal peptidase TraF
MFKAGTTAQSIHAVSADYNVIRFQSIAIIASAIAIVGLAAPLSKMPRLIWNATASAPIGLYEVRSQATFSRGELVLVRPPKWVRIFAAARGYLPDTVPMAKRIAAQNGDSVCRERDAITINHRVVASALLADRDGRTLPTWSGCRRLGKDDVFLLMDSVRASFDSRYFGPVPTTAIIGKLVPVWTR